MRWPAFVLLALAAGCSREPEFDERYDEARKQIEDTAREIDTEIKERARKAEERKENPQPDPTEPSKAT